MKNAFKRLFTLAAAAFILYGGSAPASAASGPAGGGASKKSRYNAEEREKKIFRSCSIAGSSCYEYEVALGERLSAPRLLFTNRYDERANLTLTLHYDEKDALVRKDHYIYDASGNRLAKIAKTPCGSVISKWIYKCDGASRVVRMTLFGASNEMRGSWSIKYDDDGRPVEIIELDGDGALFNRSSSVYSGDKIFETNYDDDGEIGGKRVYTLDARGKKTAAVFYDGAGAEKTRTLYTYDTAENIIENSAYHAGGGLSFKVVHKYDYENKLIEKTSYGADGKPEKIYRFVYDRRR